jgi:alkylation response protein AidB-like acyl-CoA dehydrogenase
MRPTLDDLLKEIRSRRDNFQVATKIDDHVVKMMREVGVYRAMVPKRFGGDQWEITRFFRMIEEIARADGSAGWVASFGIAGVYLTLLPLATLEELYANGPDIAFAGGNFPAQRVERVKGGLKISGRWPWGSGCSGADVIGVGIMAPGENGEDVPLLAIVRKSAVTIDERWNVNGLRGTGSYEVVCDNVVIPESWTFPRGGKPSIDEPLYRYPVMALSSQILSLVTLGVARSAIDELMAMASSRVSLAGGTSFANRPSVQSELAKAEASLRSARAFLYEQTEEACEILSAGNEIDQTKFVLLRLAATNAAHTSAEVAHRIYKISGTTGIYRDSVLGRALQDALVIPQHAFLADATWQQWGAALLGKELTVFPP